MEFRDRHVVVTGGTGALGLAVVQALAREGASVHVSYVVAAEAERFPLREHASVRLVGPIELTREADVDRLYRGVSNLWASIHLAGGFAMGGIVDAPAAIFLQQMEMNALTAYLCCRAAVRAMRSSGGGRIVNVAARPALEGRAGAGMAAYAASKAAVATLSMALAEEVVKDGILVNAIAPSVLDTPANRKAMPTADHAAWPKVEEVARMILSLASPENHVARGGIVPVYGRV